MILEFFKNSERNSDQKSKRPRLLCTTKLRKISKCGKCVPHAKHISVRIAAKSRSKHSLSISDHTYITSAKGPLGWGEKNG